MIFFFFLCILDIYAYNRGGVCFKKFYGKFGDNITWT